MVQNSIKKKLSKNVMYILVKLLTSEPMSESKGKIEEEREKAVC